MKYSYNSERVKTFHLPVLTLTFKAVHINWWSEMLNQALDQTLFLHLFYWDCFAAKRLLFETMYVHVVNNLLDGFVVNNENALCFGTPAQVSPSSPSVIILTLRQCLYSKALFDGEVSGIRGCKSFVFALLWFPSHQHTLSANDPINLFSVFDPLPWCCSCWRSSRHL